MSTPDGTSWMGLLTLMLHGPDLPVHGVISSRLGADPAQYEYGWTEFTAQPRPVFAGVITSVTIPIAGELPAGGELVEREPVLTRVWRSGRQRLRLERSDGWPSLIVDDGDSWHFFDGDPVPVHSSGGVVVYQGDGTELLCRREATSFLSDDFTRPTGPVGATTFLGRPAYTVELAPPPHKPYPIQLVVDAETGLVLQQRNDGFGSVNEWVELTVGEPLDDSLFRWQGPSVSQADELVEYEQEWLTSAVERSEWFAANVTAPPLRVELGLEVFVHEHGPDGSFQASVGKSHLGMLARRPSSDADWELGWAEVQHRWSAGGWDWAFSWHGDQLTEAGLAGLKQSLSGT